MHNKTIQLYLLDGNPNERVICNLSNWDGTCYKIPKTKIKESRERKDLENTGIYLLFGKINDEDAVYIGEAENVYDRLLQHLSGKDFWNECIIFVKKENGLNKAHAKYIENRLYNSALECNRYIINNSTIPAKISISEFEISAMEEFVYYIKMLTNVLGYKVFEKIINNKTLIEANKYYINSIGLKAKGMLTNEGFVVFKGSQSNSEFKKASASSLYLKWQQLKGKGIIDSNNIFTRDCLFTSPSLAAAMVLCRNANGLTEWKNKDKETLKSQLSK